MYSTFDKHWAEMVSILFYFRVFMLTSLFDGLDVKYVVFFFFLAKRILTYWLG